MHYFRQGKPWSSRKDRQRAGAAWLLATLLLCSAGGGCASLTNPVAEGVPVCRLPEELLGEPKEGKVTIPLTLLGQQPPEVYRLAPDDVLGISYIPGIPGEAGKNPPVYFPSQINPFGNRLQAAVGLPITVRENGTVSLPLVDPIAVQGMTIAEAEQAIRRAYLGEGTLKKPQEKGIIVTLMQQRQYRVNVIRQESGGFTTAGAGGLIATSSKRGTGNLLDMPAYENDVLNALTRTGGMPGIDAYNEVIIFKRGQKRPGLVEGLQALPPHGNPLALACPGQKIIEIPLRLPPGAPAPFGPQDILLDTGDVVFLETRDIEVFYAGGLLPAGEYTLPLDYDMDVVRAVAFVKGSMVNGAFGGSNLSGTLIAPGLGNPSPSLLTVLRRTPGGGQVAIRVDLNRALRDPRERILVQPQDVLILQETPGESLARYLTETFFNFNLSWEAIHERFATGVINVAAPDRINGVPAPSATIPGR